MLPDRALRGSDALRYGRGLLIATGVVVSVALPLLHPTTRDLVVVVAVSAFMITVLVASLFVPWQRWTDRPTIVFPVSVMIGLAAVGFFTRSEIGTCFIALFMLCFGYIGVYERRHMSFLVLPVALPCYVLSIHAWDSSVVVRLTVATAVWILVAEMLSHLMHQQHLVAEMLDVASRTDDLTHLSNRRDLESRLAKSSVGDTLVMCDLDHFKQLNDSLGHAAGDVVLRDFGAVLLGSLRGDDYAARYGGEEFVLILAETDADQTHDVLVRLRRRWAEAHPEITFSAGYAANTGQLSAHEQLESADQAMYAAKASGRDCFRSANSVPVAR